MPAQEFNRYSQAVNNASLLAQRYLHELFDKIRDLPPESIRDALIALVPGIIYKYGSMAALAAAEYFESERVAAGGSPDHQATLSEGVPLEQIESSIRFAAGHLFPEEGSDGVRPGEDASLFERQDR